MGFIMRHLRNGLLPALFCITAGAAAAQAAPDRFKAVEAAPPKYTATLSYDFLDRAGTGREMLANIYTARLTEALSGSRRQYFLLSGNFANASEGTQRDDADTASLAYGQIWRGPAPGLIFNLGGYFSKSWNDYGSTALVGDSYVHSGSAGIIGGVDQVLPLNGRNAFVVGSSFALAYLLVDNTPGTRQGIMATAYPYAQFNHIFMPRLSGYARLGTAVSTHDVAITGSSLLLMPAVGVDYKFGEDYSVGARYTREYTYGHRGERIGVSLSKSF